MDRDALRRSEKRLTHRTALEPTPPPTKSPPKPRISAAVRTYPHLALSYRLHVQSKHNTQLRPSSSSFSTSPNKSILNTSKLLTPARLENSRKPHVISPSEFLEENERTMTAGELEMSRSRGHEVSVGRSGVRHRTPPPFRKLIMDRRFEKNVNLPTLGINMKVGKNETEKKLHMSEVSEYNPVEYRTPLNSRPETPSVYEKEPFIKYIMDAMRSKTDGRKHSDGNENDVLRRPKRKKKQKNKHHPKKQNEPHALEQSEDSLFKLVKSKERSPSKLIVRRPKSSGSNPDIWENNSTRKQESDLYVSSRPSTALGVPAVRRSPSPQESQEDTRAMYEELYELMRRAGGDEEYELSFQGTSKSKRKNIPEQKNGEESDVDKIDGTTTEGEEGEEGEGGEEGEIEQGHNEVSVESEEVSTDQGDTKSMNIILPSPTPKPLSPPYGATKPKNQNL